LWELNVANLLTTLTSGRNGSAASRYSLGELGSFGYGGNTYSYGTASQSGRVGQGFTAYVAEAYQNNGPVYACVQTRLLLFAEARFAWRRFREGRPGDLFSTAALALLERPWPGGTTGDLLARMEQDVSLAGNSFILRRADRLVRLRPDYVTVAMSGAADDWDMTVDGYVYAPPQQQAVLFEPDEVAHYMPIPDPVAPWRGMSWLTPILKDIDADNAAQTHRLQFYEHAATPNLMLKFDPTVRPDTVNTYAKLFRDTYEGTENAYKTAFIGGGADPVTVGHSFEQMNFKAVQGAGETRIAAAAGVPPVIVGLSEGLQAATYSNYAQARRRLADGTIRPLWRNAAASLERLFPPPSDGQLWYDERDVAWLREDADALAAIRQTDAQTIRNLVDAGYDPDAAISAVTNNNMALLKGAHSGLFSVQLQPPDTGETPTETPATEDTPDVPTD
jgi:phage portal protein BeeE